MKYDKINRRTTNLSERLSVAERALSDMRQQHEFVSDTLNSVLHEIRRLSAELASRAEQLSRRIASPSNSGLSPIELSDAIMYMAGMMASRLALTDLELNPKAIETQTFTRAGIYRKFDKAVRVLSLRAREKRVKIDVKGTSFMKIEALPAFELVPFVLIDNAIKYSPPDQDVLIEFSEYGPQELTVTISSTGPFVEVDEIEKIFERKFRGHNAKVMNKSGQGLGLYFAKVLCELHGINIKAATGPRLPFELAGVPQAIFSITLDIRR